MVGLQSKVAAVGCIPGIWVWIWIDYSNKTDLHRIEYKYRLAGGIKIAWYNWPRSFSCAARCQNTKYHVITNATYSCHNRDPVPAMFKHVTNIETCTLLCCDHITLESSGCKHGGKQCSLLWQKHQNSSEISVDRLIKVDEKMSVSNIIHVSYIRS